jgi:radical SAM superfamily enzyme YgiQ (UPF0313 family)
MHTLHAGMPSIPVDLVQFSQKTSIVAFDSFCDPPVPDIVLTTLNARYIHASFGLRYLMANLGPLRARAAILEFDISQRPTDVLEAILLREPLIVGVGVYIWNAAQSLQLVADLKRVRPDVIVVLGGPEVSYETEQQEICRLADYVIAGEADLAFAELCETVLAGRKPLVKVIPAELRQFEIKATLGQSDGATKENTNTPAVAPPFVAPWLRRSVALPYDLYDDQDVAHRVIYVEASRGCPFKCEFCLSSLDVPVRNVPLDGFLAAMVRLLERGVRQFKFVDRTFNLNLNISRAILDFFYERYAPGLFLHFEMIPDRLPEALRGAIARFPPGSLQFEVGVQTFNEDVAALISRRQDNAKLEDNLRWLRERTAVHVHTDLIVGLPGEDLASLGRGFDRLVALRPQEIQVGMLKRLRGTPIVRHDREWGMIYSPHPPYEVLRTKLIDFPTMQRLRRFGRYWDLYANSGNFTATLPMMWEGASPFERFLRFSDWLHARLGRNHGIGLHDLAVQLFTFLTAELQLDRATVAQSIWRDYQRCGRSDRPAFLVGVIDLPVERRRASNANAAPRRQARHLA